MKTEVASKVCPKCGECKPHSDFYSDKSCKDGLMRACKTCVRAAKARYYAENPGRAKDSMSRYRARYPERTKVAMDRYKNSDAYIRREMAIATPGLDPGDIPPELISLKREQLQLRRLSQQLKKAAKEHHESKPEHP